MVKTSSLVHQPVDHQPVLGGIDLGDAGMVAFEAQSVGRDDAIEFMQRCEIDRGNRVGCQPGHITAHDFFLELRWRPVGSYIDAVTGILVPVLLFQNGRIAIGKGRSSCCSCAAKGQTGGQS